MADQFGTDNGLPQGGICSGVREGEGASIGDASIPTQFDAFDIAVMFWISDVQVGGHLTMEDENTAQFSPVELSGLSAQLQYKTVGSEATLRALLEMHNPTHKPITVHVDYAANFGSDDGTAVKATSSGDTLFTAQDRWIVTDDFDDAGFDPAVTTVLFGPTRGRGRPEVTASSVSETVFWCIGTQGVQAGFDVKITPGKTQSLMIFQQLNPTSADAIASADTFDQEPTPDSPLVSDLTETELKQIVNWTFKPHR